MKKGGTRVNQYRNIKINPLAGMHDIKLMIPLFLVFLFIAIFTSATVQIAFFIISLILLLFLIGRLYVRLFKPWCRLHFPIMHKYSYFTGIQLGLL